MVEPNPGNGGERLPEARNTRDVFPIRLSGREREQIAGAAQRRKLTVGGFVREAALAASAIVEKVTPQPVVPPERALVVEECEAEPEPQAYFVDGEPVPRRQRALHQTKAS